MSRRIHRALLEWFFFSYVDICWLLVSNSPTRVVKIVFIDFETEKRYDYVSIYDGRFVLSGEAQLHTVNMGSSIGMYPSKSYIDL